MFNKPSSLRLWTFWTVLSLAIANLIYTFFLWLKTGTWWVISIGGWLSNIFPSINHFNTGWKGFDKILDYLLIDSNASITLGIIAFVIMFTGD